VYTSEFLRVFELEDTKFNIRCPFILTHLSASMQIQPASRSSSFYIDLIFAMVDLG
jgi:hypothetical protein